MATKMTPGQIRKLPDSELKVLAMEKNRIGNATSSALIAQKELYDRHYGIRRSTRVKRLSDEWDYR